MMRLPPAKPTEHFSVEIPELDALSPQEVDFHLLALPALPAEMGTLASPLDSQIHLELKGQHLLLKATAEGDLKLVCHRCLREYPYHAKLRIDEHMVVQADGPLDEELEWEMATVAETVDPNGSLDLVDWLRQHLILDLPAKQLCEQAVCETPQASVAAEDQGDPRWANLRRLTSPQGDDHGTT